MAAQGLEISMAGGTLTATGHTEGQAIIFSYQASCGDDSKPCYVFHSIAGTEDAGTTAPGCKTEAGITECPATGIGKITINMAANGNFEFNDGSHHVTCSPAPVTIQTGATLANIDIWNGCSETVICEAKTTVATVNADASDSIRGHCMVEKH
jgi:hypothetical protein